MARRVSGAIRIAAAVICFIVALDAQAQQYDLLLRGGHVVDPRNQLSALRDVAIRDGRIVRVAVDTNRALRRRPSM